jgi:acyl-CoA reductase-like NAD-dependent aldehyde dehydrogenase
VFTFAFFFQIVHENIYDEVLERLKKAYSQLKIGDPLEPNTIYGPLHTKRSVELYLEAIETAKKLGGNIVYGGKVIRLNFVYNMSIDWLVEFREKEK